MRADRVVLVTPGFDQNPGLLQGVEDFAIEEFVPQPGIEALDIAVLPRASWRDIGGLGAHGSDPCLHGLGNELRPVI